MSGILSQASHAGADDSQDITTLVTVLSYDQVRDIYSKAIAENYQVASVTVLNGTDHGILLQTISFTPPVENSQGTGKSVANNPIVVNTVATVIQDLHRKEEHDFRTRFNQILQYGSIILPGPTPFFKNVLSRGTYNQGLSIFNLARTSAFDTWPDFYEEVYKLLQSSKLFTKNFQIASKSSDTVDVFISNEQLQPELFVPNAKTSRTGKKYGLFSKRGSHPLARTVLDALGKVTVYSVQLPADAKVQSSVPATKP